MTPFVLSIPMRYFLEVAETGSVSKAAARLFVAGSAVSRQIARLEASLATALFERKPRGMRLTPAGERLAAQLRTLAADAEAMLGEVRADGARAGGQVRVACTEGFAPGFMPDLLSRFREAHPGARFSLQVAAPDEVSTLLLRGDVDLALKYATSPERGLQVEHAAPAPVLAVMTPDHPLARRRELRLAEVVRYPLAVGPRGVTARTLLDLSCSMQGLHYEPSVVSNFSSVLLRMLRAPDILLSGYLTAGDWVQAGRLVALPLVDEQMQQRRLNLLRLESRSLSPMAQALARMLVEVIEASGPRPKGDM